jgi:protein-tyrosine phosphatase
VLCVCTGNVCRSPMLEVMLGSALRARGVDATVSSAGVWEAGHPASGHSVSECTDRGLDLHAHRSRVIDAAMVGRADLVLALAREHVRAVAGLVPEAFPRTFTIKELVRRGRAVGPRRPDEPLDGWLASAGQGRAAATYLRADADDDVADPIGGTRAQYARTAAELEALSGALAGLLAAPAIAPLALDFGAPIEP